MRPIRRQFVARRLQPVGEETTTSRNSKKSGGKMPKKSHPKRNCSFSTLGCLPVKLRTKRRKLVAKQSYDSIEPTIYECRVADAKSTVSQFKQSITIQPDSVDVTFYTHTDASTKETPWPREKFSKKPTSKIVSSETFLESCRPPCEGKEASPAKLKHTKQISTETTQITSSSLFLPVENVVSAKATAPLYVANYSCRGLSVCGKEDIRSMTSVTRLNISDWPTLAVF